VNAPVALEPVPGLGTYRSKTIATWLAFLGGSLGLHRIYLYGLRDRWAALHAVPTLVGLYGVHRLRTWGVDDQLAWVLIPWLGLILSATMLVAIVYGLMPDEKWNARFNPIGQQHQTSWSTIIGVMLALMVGGGVLMATLAYSIEHYFVYEAESEPPR